VRKYEQDGNETAADAALAIAAAGMAHGDLLAGLGLATEARDAWQGAATRVRPNAEHLAPAAMTLLAGLDLRLGGAQDARVWADRVKATTYRHPAFADIEKKLGLTQQAGETSSPLQGKS